MPSRPMLTTPERSDHRPPRPASRIGTDATSAARRAPVELTSSAPVIWRHRDNSTNAARTYAPILMTRFCGSGAGPALGGVVPAAGTTTLMPVASSGRAAATCSATVDCSMATR